jgi:hypothetical protein
MKRPRHQIPYQIPNQSQHFPPRPPPIESNRIESNRIESNDPVHQDGVGGLAYSGKIMAPTPFTPLMTRCVQFANVFHRSFGFNI